MVLFEESEKRERDKFVLLGRMLGIKIDEEKDTSPVPKTFKEQGFKNKMLFRDPADYEKMTKEERETLTKEMKDHWQVKFNQKKAQT